MQITFPNVRDGLKNVTTAGTAERLVAARTAAYALTIQAKFSNTDVICVGDSTVVAANTGQRGIPLQPGMSITLNVEDLYQVWIDAAVNGEGVTFIYQF